MQLKRLLFAGLLMVLVFSGCAPSPEEIAGKTAIAMSTVAANWTATPMPTSTEIPTSTALPTATQTLVPTASPSPTPTIEPPAQFSGLLENPRIVAFDGFDYFIPEQWETQACSSVIDGELVFTCRGGFFGRKDHPFHEGEGVLVDFIHQKQTDDYYWGINLSSGEYGLDNWRQIGLSENTQYGQSVSVQKGDTWLGSNPRWIKADIWYRLLLAIDPNGSIMLAVWERDKPDAQPWKYRNTMGKDWAGLEWWWWMNCDKDVTIHLDNYSEIKFDKFK